jgi:hypothetical protein
MKCNYPPSNDHRRGYLYDEELGLYPITYSVLDGLAIMQGDMVLGPIADIEAGESLIAASQVTRSPSERSPMTIRPGVHLDAIAIAGTNFRWSEATIPFVIDPTYPTPEIVNQAIEHYRRTTSIRFVERTNELNFVRFMPRERNCRSRVGMVGGEQTIELGPTCDAGDTVHEIGHTLGLKHEHARSDRDSFIRINWDNVPAANVPDYTPVIPIPGMVDIGQYDYASVMHYGRRQFTIDPNIDSITPLQPDPIGRIRGLSDGDADALDRMYGLPLRTAAVSNFDDDGTVDCLLERHRWSRGWNATSFQTAFNQFFVLLTKAAGFGGDGNNAHIHRVAEDGGIGEQVDARAWSEGWTTVCVYMPSGESTQKFLLLMKQRGAGVDGNNLHFHSLNADGTLGARIDNARWSEGWTKAIAYKWGGLSFILFLRSQGFESDGTNVRIFAVRPDGTLGERVFQRGWTEGWDVAAFHAITNSPTLNATYLYLIKSRGYGSDGNNIHVHRMSDDGTPGPRIFAARWTQGWTTCVPYNVGEHHCLLIHKREGVGGDRRNVHIHRLLDTGAVGPRIQSLSWRTGWRSVIAYGPSNRLRLLKTMR